MPQRAKQYRPNSVTPRQPTEEARGTRHQRGYTARWSRVSKAYLLSHPLCVLCAEKNRITAATCVDHIDGLGPLGTRGYDEDNFRALCTRCHNSRTAKDRHAKRKT